MLTGQLKSKIDALWDAFWSGGISNPLEVMEQTTYLLFLKRLDDIQNLEENKARTLKQEIKNPVFPEGFAICLLFPMAPSLFPKLGASSIPSAIQISECDL